MNNTYILNPYQNVSNNDRAFRGVLGMGLLTTVAAGTFASPVVIFGTSMAAVYLVMTTIIGSDPVYSAARAASISTDRNDLVTS